MLNARRPQVVLLAGPAASTRRHAAWAVGNLIDGFPPAKAALRKYDTAFPCPSAALLRHPTAVSLPSLDFSLPFHCPFRCGGISALVGLLGHPSADVARAATGALGTACIDDPAARAYARQAVRRPTISHESPTHASPPFFGRIGDRGSLQGATERVTQLLSSRDRKLQKQAAWALGHLVGGGGAPGSAALASKLERRQGEAVVELARCPPATATTKRTHD